MSDFLTNTELTQSWELHSREEAQQLAYQLAQCCHAPAIITLSGELGTGKTTFVQGFLAYFGFQDAGQSPTYTLVETYDLPTSNLEILHFDLYRLNDPRELEGLGFREYLHLQSICLIEWPEKAAGYLPAADLHCNLIYLNVDKHSTSSNTDVPLSRRFTIQAGTSQGQKWLQNLSKMKV